MEYSEREHIRAHLYELILLTSCNRMLISILNERGILSYMDIAFLMAENNMLERALKLYQILEARKGAYQALKDALNETLQPEPVKILNQLFDKSPPPADSDKGTGQDKRRKITEDDEVDILNIVRNINALSKLDRQSESHEMSGEEIVDFLHNHIQQDPSNSDPKLDVFVRKPTRDQQVQLQKSKYTTRKAYAFILNIIKFKGPCPACKTELRNTRQGAHVDTANLTKLLGDLKFQIFPDMAFRDSETKTKEEIVAELESFRKKCIKEKVDCILIFIGSLGYNNMVITSDKKILDIYSDVIYKFQFSENELKEPVAKIFINNSCQVDPPAGVSNSISSNVEPDVTHTFYVKAQMSKHLAYRDDTFGSYFVLVLTAVFMRKSYNKSLLEMMTEVQRCLKLLSKKMNQSQLCPITQMDFDSPFYFFSGDILAIEELKEIITNGKELAVSVIQPGLSQPPRAHVYSLPPKGKGYAFILNIIEVYGEERRRGAYNDTKYMTELWEGLGFKIFPEEEDFRVADFKSEQMIRKKLELFKQKCIDDKVDCFVIFFGSHGYNDFIMTSDRKVLNVYDDIIYPFQFEIKENVNGEETVKRVARIFLVQACQNAPSEKLLQIFHSSQNSLQTTEEDMTNTKDTLYMKAQLVNYKAGRDEVCGSYFVTVLTYVLMAKARNTPLLDMIYEIQQLLQNVREGAGAKVRYLLQNVREEAGAKARQLPPANKMGLVSPFYFLTD